MKLIKKIIKRYKQSKCDHCITENYLSGSSSGPKIWDNYCTYSCMLCNKQIKFLGKVSNQTQAAYTQEPNKII